MGQYPIKKILIIVFVERIIAIKVGTKCFVAPNAATIFNRASAFTIDETDSMNFIWLILPNGRQSHFMLPAITEIVFHFDGFAFYGKDIAQSKIIAEKVPSIIE